MLKAEIDGAPATAEMLLRPAVHNYGHMTSMQVRNGHVRGLSLHVERLRAASRELFGRPLEGVTEHLRTALEGTPDAVSVRINVFSDGEPGGPADSHVLITVGPPAPDEPEEPLRVCSARYDRDLPHLKHVGTLGLIHQRRLAFEAGFDDVLFVDGRDCVSEGSIWNVGFFDGERIVWPEAPMLSGITEQLLRIGFARAGVPTEVRPVRLDALGGMRAAFAANSICPAQPIRSVDDVVFAGDDRLPGLLARAWDAVPPEPV